MRNTDQIRENTAGGADLPADDPGRRSTGCAMPASPPGRRCAPRATAVAARPPAPTAELGNLTRFLTYHEHHGYRAEARRLYAELADAARNWKGADLEAARAACPNHLDFAALLPRADELLG